MTGEARSLLEGLKAACAKEPCDVEDCSRRLSALKLAVLPALPSLSASAESSSDVNADVVGETLETACFLSIRQQDLAGFERHVSQLKMCYGNRGGRDAEQKYPILGLFLLHLLASDRIGDFHTELELIPVEDYENVHIQRPIEIERALMEGNYAKVLEAQKSFPKDCHYSVFMERLLETVRLKVGASMERTYDHVTAKDAAAMLILPDIAKLQEFAIKENERKARAEANDNAMMDMTPSLTRRAPLGLVKWEVKGDKLHFSSTEERKLEIPAVNLMINTIGYATDLERIV